MDKNEILRTVAPDENIPCKTCKYKLEAVTVMEQVVHRYNYGTCHAFKNKPQGILWDGEQCELYSKE